MSLKEHYNKLYTSAIDKIYNDKYELDSLIDSNTDNRFGITLLIRPSIAVKNKIQAFLNKLYQIDPNQYYYKNTDIHITVLSIISCYQGFQIKNININDYVNVIKESIIENGNLKIEFKGLTASPSCIMLQGFTNNESLNTIRDNLRNNFKNTILEQSIDQRYAIQTAHSTVVRFRNKLINKINFLKIIEQYRDHNFGTFTPQNLELVHNDWYQRKTHVKTLASFSI
ncbi:MAG: 2'-5' RNA ligase family protein [Aestuariibaculum sp.]